LIAVLSGALVRLNERESSRRALEQNLDYWLLVAEEFLITSTLTNADPERYGRLQRLWRKEFDLLEGGQREPGRESFIMKVPFA
jgi:hypothetical protein